MKPFCFECGRQMDDFNNPLSKAKGAVCLKCALEIAFYKKDFVEISELMRELHIGIAILRNLTEMK